MANKSASKRRKLPGIGPCLVAALILFPVALLPQEGGPERQRVNNLNDQVRTLEQTTRRGEFQHAAKPGEFSIEDILRDDYKKSLQDIEKIQRLAETLKTDLQKNDPHVLSASSVKMTEEIEKLAKKLRSRLRRF